IKDIRGNGLLIAVEFTEDGRDIVEELKNNGILAKDTHSTTIRFAPPLVITREEIDWAIEIIDKVFVM
ncbi:MAG: aminotransferase class III-fold pyridoxal phosphate-dependent enzyme, partial [Promethearchaeota archaeon]